MSLKIGIVGASGTGKSSLARTLARHLGIKSLESKTITQDILERDGYDYGSGVQVERFLANTGRQNEILRRTMEREDKEENGFVTDRTVVDLAAYVVAELHSTDTRGLSDLYNTCQDRVKDYTHLFLCPWKECRVTENYKRTLNPWYQFQIHALEVGIMNFWDMPFTVIESEGPEERVEEIVNALKKL